ncbi:MAG: hypothetical protein HY721_07705 [Planctomycetes bacterium]|nr:hypothetical protein [Planctomycetota bacterium]
MKSLALKTIRVAAWLSLVLAFCPGFSFTAKDEGGVKEERTVYALGIIPSPLFKYEVVRTEAKAPEGGSKHSVSSGFEVSLGSLGAGFALFGIGLLLVARVLRKRAARSAASPERTEKAAQKGQPT